MKKQMRNFIFSPNVAILLTKIAQKRVQASRLSLPFCLMPARSRLAIWTSFFISFWQNQLYIKNISQLSSYCSSLTSFDLWNSWILMPISSSRVGDFVKLCPRIPIFLAVFCNFAIFNSLLYYSMISWMGSFFFMLLATCYREDIELSFAIGRGTTLPSLPFLTRNMRSRLSTLSSLGLLFAITPETFLGMRFLPSNLTLKVLVSRKGLIHLISLFCSSLFSFTSFLKNLIFCSIGLDPLISCENFRAFKLPILVLTSCLVSWSMEGSDIVLLDSALTLSSLLLRLETMLYIFFSLYFLRSEKLISLDWQVSDFYDSIRLRFTQIFCRSLQYESDNFTPLSKKVLLRLRSETQDRDWDNDFIFFCEFLVERFFKQKG